MKFVPAIQNLTPPPVRVDVPSGTIRPESAEGDEYYGLTRGTNGTAAIARRACVEAVVGAGLLTWVRACGSPATGIAYVPSDRSDDAPNPRAGRARAGGQCVAGVQPAFRG
jgi:hypothetical protein